MSSSLLGEFLRARREAARPRDTDLPTPRRRRTPGLRREDIAVRAGISVDYYSRLEQGRERHPSTQVLSALARALSLDATETAHLHDLAAPATRPPTPGGGPSRHLVLAMRSWADGPAYIINRRCDVVCRNASADALFAPFADADNILRLMFLDPRFRSTWANWEDFAAAIVAGVRGRLGAAVDEPAMRRFFDELCSASADFAELWARREVKAPRVRRKVIRHPDLGVLDLDYDLLSAIGDPEHMLITHADRDTEG